MMETIFFGLLYFVGGLVLTIVGMLCVWSITVFADVLMTRLAKRLKRDQVERTPDGRKRPPARPAGATFSPAPPSPPLRGLPPGMKIGRITCTGCGETFDSWDGFLHHLEEAER